MNSIEEIKRLKSLLDRGAITNEEFQQLKSKLISDGSSNINIDSTLSESTQINTPVKKSSNKRKRFYIIPIIIGLITILIVTYFFIFNGNESVFSGGNSIYNRLGYVFSSKSFKDIDGNKYKTVQIGEQIWMAENLNVSKFRNGDPISEVKTGEEWEKTHYDERPAWCYYNNDPMNGEKYGKLYNWHAVSDPRGLAPEGWHIASTEEWNCLISSLGGNDIASVKLRFRSEKEYENRTNGSEYSAPPSGIRDEYLQNKFIGLNSIGGWWTKDVYDQFSALRVFSDCRIKDDFKGKGYSVRCVKDTKNDNQSKSLIDEDRSKDEHGFISEDGERMGILIKREYTYSNKNNAFILNIPAGKMWTPIYYEYDNIHNCSYLRTPTIYTEKYKGKSWSRNSGFDFRQKSDFVSYKVCKRNRTAIGEGDICIGFDDVSCESIKYTFYFLEE